MKFAPFGTAPASTSQTITITSPIDSCSRGRNLHRPARRSRRLAHMDDKPDASHAPMLDYRSAAGEGRSWKTILRAQTVVEANLAASALQENGLHARVDFEN